MRIDAHYSVLSEAPRTTVVIGLLCELHCVLRRMADCYFNAGRARSCPRCREEAVVCVDAEASKTTLNYTTHHKTHNYAVAEHWRNNRVCSCNCCYANVTYIYVYIYIQRERYSYYIYIYIYNYTCLCVYVCIYIYTYTYIPISLPLSMYIYIYIYI